MEEVFTDGARRGSEGRVSGFMPGTPPARRGAGPWRPRAWVALGVLGGLLLVTPLLGLPSITGKAGTSGRVLVDWQPVRRAGANGNQATAPAVILVRGDAAAASWRAWLTPAQFTPPIRSGWCEFRFEKRPVGDWVLLLIDAASLRHEPQDTSTPAPDPAALRALLADAVLQVELSTGEAAGPRGMGWSWQVVFDDGTCHVFINDRQQSTLSWSWPAGRALTPVLLHRGIDPQPVGPWRLRVGTGRPVLLPDTPAEQ